MPTTAKHKKPPDQDLRRPFDPRVLKRAKAIADRYKLVLWREDGHWFGCGIEQPGAMGDGRTIEAAARSTRRSMQLAVAVTMELGDQVPQPQLDRERRRRKAG